MKMKPKRPTIGITMGDPLGIGPEILVKALNNIDLYQEAKLVVIGDIHALEQAMALLNVQLKINTISRPDQGIYQHRTLDLISASDINLNFKELKSPNIETGIGMESYIIQGIQLALDHRIDALVTAPITKTAMKLAGSKFHGHTELLADMTSTNNYAMMLAGQKLKVVLVTIHIPLAKVSNLLTTQSIIKTIRLTHSGLKKRFNIKSPRIGVAGLNPHAGEDKMFGSEESLVIKPAVSKAIQEGINVTGPLPPDTVFYQAVNDRYDAVVCMYHDQGLIPFKLIHFKDGVNTTLGLPIIRTSVDHGTAYDIAWKGIADPTSLIEAIKMAVFQARNQFNFCHTTSDNSKI